jgi:hypothetical protein
MIEQTETDRPVLDTVRGEAVCTSQTAVHTTQSPRTDSMEPLSLSIDRVQGEVVCTLRARSIVDD